MTPKELKQLAKACRAAGIKTYKSGTVEFTLTDEAPTARPGKSTQPASPDKAFATDALTQEELLFWSSGGHNETDKENSD